MKFDDEFRGVFFLPVEPTVLLADADLRIVGLWKTSLPLRIWLAEGSSLEELARLEEAARFEMLGSSVDD